MKYYGIFENGILTNASQLPIYTDNSETREISQQEYELFMGKEKEKQSLVELRVRREHECFSIINRGKLWYDNLTEEQLLELQIWYDKWLNVTQTKLIPEKPSWIK